MMLLERHPSFRAAQMRLEGATSKRRDLSAAKKARILTIKTVVHVVYKTADQNISAAQIRSQIRALNKDFRATNPDKTQTPPPFKGLVSDARVKFRLVKVTRTKTTSNGFSFDDRMKKASTGGIAPYLPKTHLNLWVCALTGGLL
ncbi:MAG: zinc metalloprotease, partial [Betaproteobacteria bacterium]|nr:zinc metalloprotease [Betaproteobacteria bacterium]